MTSPSTRTLTRSPILGLRCPATRADTTLALFIEAQADRGIVSIEREVVDGRFMSLIDVGAAAKCGSAPAGS